MEESDGEETEGAQENARTFSWKRSKSRNIVRRLNPMRIECAKHEICKQLQNEDPKVESSQSLRRYPGKPESPWSSSVCAESSSEGEDESMVSLVRMYGGGPGSRRNLHPIELKLAAIEKIKAGGLIADVAKQMELPVGLISGWWLSRAEIQEKSESFVAKTLINEFDEKDARNFYVLKPSKQKVTKPKPGNGARGVEETSTTKETASSSSSSSHWPSVWEDLGVPSPSHQAKAIIEHGEEGEGSSTSESLLRPLLKKRTTKSKAEKRRESTDSWSSSGRNPSKRARSASMASISTNEDPSEEQLKRHLNESTGEWSAQLFLHNENSNDSNQQLEEEGEKVSLTQRLMRVRKPKRSSASRASQGNKRSKGKKKGKESWSCEIMNPTTSSEESNGRSSRQSGCSSRQSGCSSSQSERSSRQSGRSSQNSGRSTSLSGRSSRQSRRSSQQSRQGTPESLLRDSSPEEAVSPPPAASRRSDVDEAVGARLSSTLPTTNHIPPIESVSFSMEALLQKERSSGKPATSTTVGSETTRPAREVDRLYELSREDRDRSESPNLDYVIEEAPRVPKEPHRPKQDATVKTENSETPVKKEQSTPEKPTIVEEPVTPVLNILERVASSSGNEMPGGNSEIFEPAPILPQFQDEESNNDILVGLPPSDILPANSPEKAVSPPSYPLALYKLEPDGDEVEALPGGNCDIAQTSPINYNKEPKRSIPPSVGVKLKNLPGIRILPPSEQKESRANKESKANKSVYQSSTIDVIIVPQPDPDPDNSSLDIVELDPDPDQTKPYQYIPNKEVMPYKGFDVVSSSGQPFHQQQPQHQLPQQYPQESYQQQQQQQQRQDGIQEVFNDDVILLPDMPDEYSYHEYYDEQDPASSSCQTDQNNAYYAEQSSYHEQDTNAYYTSYSADSTNQQYNYATPQYANSPRRMSSSRRGGGGQIHGPRGRGATSLPASPSQNTRGGFASARVRGPRTFPLQSVRGPSPRGSPSPRVSSRGGGVSPNYRGGSGNIRPSVRGIMALRGGPSRMGSPRQVTPRLQAPWGGSPAHRGPGPSNRRPGRQGPPPATAVRGRNNPHTGIQSFPVGSRSNNSRFQLNRNAGNTRGNLAATYQQQQQQQETAASNQQRSFQQPQQPAHGTRPLHQPQQSSAAGRGFNSPRSPAQRRGTVQSPSNRAAGFGTAAQRAGNAQAASASPVANEPRQRVSLQVTSDQIEVLKSLGIIK